MNTKITIHKEQTVESQLLALNGFILRIINFVSLHNPELNSIVAQPQSQTTSSPFALA